MNTIVYEGCLVPSHKRRRRQPSPPLTPSLHDLIKAAETHRIYSPHRGSKLWPGLAGV